MQTGPATAWRTRFWSTSSSARSDRRPPPRERALYVWTRQIFTALIVEPLPQRAADRQHRVRLAIENWIRADTWDEFLRRFGNIRICECYGATEGNIGFVNYTGKISWIGRTTVFSGHEGHIRAAALKLTDGMSLMVLPHTIT